MGDTNNLKFAKSHEWAKKDGDYYLIGISDYAQEQLGDIVYIEFPEKGERFEAGAPFAELESSKAVSEVNMPITGEIVEINLELEDAPELINSDALNSWIVKIRAESSADFDKLLDSDDV